MAAIRFPVGVPAGVSRKELCTEFNLKYSIVYNVTCKAHIWADPSYGEISEEPYSVVAETAVETVEITLSSDEPESDRWWEDVD